MKKILLAEDDLDLGGMLKRYLELNKFNVTWAKDGEEGLTLFKEGSYDICILDVMMPKMDGFTLAKKIVDINPEVPFLFLTARKTQDDKVKGLRLGADDYVVKPFEAEELILRLKNIIKRTHQQFSIQELPQKNTLISIGAYTFDFTNLELQFKNKRYKQLTEKEARLIYYLYSNRDQLIRRDEILAHVWSKNDFFSGRSMDVFISRIRKYFKEDPKVAITSVRGIGLEFTINNNLKPKK
ncbi:response regulator transcription factor [Ulvibacter litoralis]|uniref:DNA-binding response regulator, OmpR family, contains REC and winged-helix (WHTH) domain n=1 Tax=Ulvibacter litoralis TaxID=227084 RepID=A0A1G7FPE3_9FLAO|nr:response regulator transcription factor [Ulvibacter litoralis]GHC50276.1 DNA-binding response regulator [Ulvibacter litoralis]SDE77783.1 DNA-binding response regulator, OmpR family, contains REC and winged-helix (wHTH) domain [Ulvibacter litoralis]